MTKKWTYDYGVDHVPPLFPANDFEVLCEYGQVSEHVVPYGMGPYSRNSWCALLVCLPPSPSRTARSLGRASYTITLSDRLRSGNTRYVPDEADEETPTSANIEQNLPAIIWYDSEVEHSGQQVAEGISLLQDA